MIQFSKLKKKKPDSILPHIYIHRIRFETLQYDKAQDRLFYHLQ